MTLRPRHGAGLMLVMTDLFVSASATLLVILSLAKNKVPDFLPVQADLVALCPEKAGGAFRLMTAVQAAEVQTGTRPFPLGVPVRDANDLRRLAELPGLFPALLHVVALAGSASTPLDAACLIRFRREIITAQNNALTSAEPREGLRRIFTVVPISMPLGPEK